MSEPIKNIEIEDVLSSIRRLVAEGDRVRTDASHGAAANSPMNSKTLSAPAQGQAPRSVAKSTVSQLVLTPALRVDDADTPEFETPESESPESESLEFEWPDSESPESDAPEIEAREIDSGATEMLAPLILTASDAAPQMPPAETADDAFDGDADDVALEFPGFRHLRDDGNAKSGDARSGDARSGDARSGDARSGDARSDDSQPRMDDAQSEMGKDGSAARDVESRPAAKSSARPEAIADSVAKDDTYLLKSETRSDAGVDFGSDTGFHDGADDEILPGPDDETARDDSFMAEAGSFHSSRIRSAGDASDMRSSRASLENTIAELEAAITHQPDDWEPDGSEDTPVIDWTSASTRAGLLAARQRREDPGSIEDAEEISDTIDEDAARQRPAAAPSEETVRGSHPDAAAAQDAPGSAPDAAPGADAPRYDEPSSTTFEADASGAVFGEEAFIDEVALRALVAEIVREELQGKLGERITRNVRKLVRREIYRVIASESFD